jgi:transketolase
MLGSAFDSMKSPIFAGSTAQISPRIDAAHWPREMRRRILLQSKRANVGHIGSCLSIVEILCALYGGVLRLNPEDPDRDRFVLSKGHAALALYAALSLKGWVSDEQLNTFCGDDSLLGVHPEAALRGVDFSTGSLGHGMPMAVGAAMAARLQGSGRKAFCLISDAELNEGSVWEAAMFAAHHGLSNLIVIADMDGQQAFGLTREVCRFEDPVRRWEAFGWDAIEVDGHSVEALIPALSPPFDSNRPRIVLAQTVFGKGVWFMEQGVSISQPQFQTNPINWHYLPMSEEEFRAAMEGLEES